ncbi:hypothetical protein K443DRAFT_13606 [Laccaria amethystina LaAM-08-1]|uniref:Uncharacterized protein n=1 Tax=Laccaria amethystina LaAM-08-1 TaxID=1095629 RepID=A0A0C9X7V4_9AGAR|nr:hypothetical protein K443DRAFT_13606 [Laccaria amethystina LaAM-08-1]
MTTISTTPSINPLVLTPQPIVTPTPPSPVAQTPRPTPSLPSSSNPFQANEVIDARPNPRYATHLRPVFTEVIAEQQEKARQRDRLEAERKANAQKVKQNITLYSWTSDNTPPKVRVTQAFTWPFLSLSLALLSTIGLQDAGERGELCFYDEVDALDWVEVDVGHVVEVQEGQRILLKNRNIQCCEDLHKFLEAHSRYTTPHLYSNLSQERASVREMFKQPSLFTTPTRNPVLSSSTISTPTPIPSMPTPIPSTPTSLPSTPTPTPSTPTPVPSTPTPTPSTPTLFPHPECLGGSNNPINLDITPDGKHWPGDFYVVDIGRCIRAVNGRTHLSRQRGRHQEDMFKSFFPGVWYVASTFSDQKKIWARAHHDLQEEFINFGQRKEGLWSAFCRRVRHTM